MASGEWRRVDAGDRVMSSLGAWGTLQGGSCERCRCEWEDVSGCPPGQCRPCVAGGLVDLRPRGAGPAPPRCHRAVSSWPSDGCRSRGRTPPGKRAPLSQHTSWVRAAWFHLGHLSTSGLLLWPGARGVLSGSASPGSFPSVEMTAVGKEGEQDGAEGGPAASVPRPCCQSLAAAPGSLRARRACGHATRFTDLVSPSSP